MATKATASLESKFKALVAGVTPDTSLRKSRSVVSVVGRVHSEMVAIEQALPLLAQLEPVAIQRNDRYRLEHQLARHLTNLVLPQVVISLVEIRGKFYLIDGNTRKRHWMSQIMADLPSHVMFITLKATSKEEAEMFYRTYDSKESKKTNRDDLLSLMRTSDIDVDSLQSPLVAGGKLVSVIRRMTTAMVGGRATENRKLEVVQHHKSALLYLDRMGFNEKELLGGAVWAALRLFAEVPVQHHAYLEQYLFDIRDYHKGTKVKSLLSRAAVDAYDRSQALCRAYGIGTSGEKPYPYMAKEFLAGFNLYAREVCRKNRADEAFKRYLNQLQTKVIKPEVARIESLLPQS
jgi:hypothetical protein